MYNIGERIVYGSTGVVEIVDISEQSIAGETKKYYVVKEISGNSSSLTYIPLDNEMLVSQMRPLFTRENIDSIIEEARHIPEMDWIDDNRARSNEYKKIIMSGDYPKMIAMIGAIYNTGKRRCEEGKKNYLADENSMKKAEKLIYSEFALVLGIDESDIPAYISEKISLN